MLILPIGDEPNDKKHVAWVNYSLIAANVVAFVWMRATYATEAAFQAFILEHAYVPAVGSFDTIFKSMFMHAGWMHLGGNMLFLWIFGDNIEQRLGAFGYLLAYLAVGVGATLIYGAFRAESTMPVVGASGAISGVQGLYFIACPRHRVKVFMFLWVYVNVFFVNARWIMGIWFVMQDVIPLLISMNVNIGGGVAHLAHLGGLVSGLVLMLLLKPIAPGMREAEQGERPRNRQYAGGRARSGAYERHRKRDPYESGVRKRSRDL
ncbi:MAG: rhomboid family intramembrane serine protease [Planctomycetota bacterium]|nr:rhomboid family intramembrane serine protease [Planctomycetota bacterium]